MSDNDQPNNNLPKKACFIKKHLKKHLLLKKHLNASA